MKVALIGLGMVADTHLAALKAANGIDLCGVLARRRTTTEQFAAKASKTLGTTVKAYNDIQHLVGDTEVDFAIIATPPDARADLVENLVAARIPILMEKPVERTFAAAQDIVSRCSMASVPLGVIFQHRAREVSQLLRRLLQDGAIGDITTAELRVPWWRDQSYYENPGRGSYARDGGGVMITQAIHTLDLALWFLGPIAEIQALMHRTQVHAMEAEDWAGAVFTTRKGVAGHIIATTAAYPGSADSITLNGTKGTAHLEVGTLSISTTDGDAQTYGDVGGSGGGADPMAFTHEWHQAVIEDFAQAVRDKRAPIASGQAALLAHAVIDAMERSSASGHRVEVLTS